MLAQIIPLLSRMSYAELKDFIDYSEFYHLSKLMKPGLEKYEFRRAIRSRRSGLKSGGLPFLETDGELDPKLTGDFKGLEMTTDTQAEALRILVELEKRDLILILGEASSVRSTAAAIAWALLREKEPIRRFARGNIQVKWIDTYTRVVKDEEGNEKAEKVAAPYLYFRYSTVQGNTDRKEKRYKSLYVGPEEKSKKRGYPYQPLASLLDELIKEHGIPKPWTNPTTGQTKINKVRPTGNDNPIAHLERLIMRYVVLKGDEVEINHERLERLQYLLCGE